MSLQGRNKFKISLTAVLHDEVEYPFSLANFEKYVRKEHSEENLEFFQSIARYRERASKVWPSVHSSLRSRRTTSHGSVRSISSAFASQASLGGAAAGAGGAAAASRERLAPGASEEVLDAGERDKLKDEVDKLVALYVVPGADKEINIPATMRKKLMVEINDKKNYHPDIFKPVEQHVYLMMKTSSYPNFYREAVAYLQSKNLPMPKIEREATTERHTLDRASRSNLRDATAAQ
ncbi:hypothetical protein HDU86_002519 [Geranomyces michiganensis]|nr:hypothetical protein HDU86_002519 [Geranomyces michiganensis]